MAAPVSSSDAAAKQYVDSATATVRTAMIGEKVWKAWVATGGGKLSTGPLASTRTGAGLYAITFDVSGLGVASAFPVFAATPFTANAAFARVYGISIQGNPITQIVVNVAVADAAGALLDSSFYLLMSMPDADTGSPVPPLALLDGVRCRGEGADRTCTWTP